MLSGKRTIREAMPDFAKFCEGAVLVAHNASFDMSFFKRAFPLIGREFDFTVVDTLSMARNLYPNIKNHKLGTLAKLFNVSLTNAHRAVHDAARDGAGADEDRLRTFNRRKRHYEADAS